MSCMNSKVYNINLNKCFNTLIQISIEIKFSLAVQLGYHP